jgi:hypothetical protein
VLKRPAASSTSTSTAASSSGARPRFSNVHGAENFDSNKPAAACAKGG